MIKAPPANDPRANTWGGRRAGAGRKRAPGKLPSTPHRARPAHEPQHPVHVIMRVKADVPSLREQQVFAVVSQAITAAAVAAARTSSFRVLHFSVQSDHVHFIVEASHVRVLSSGLRGLAIRIARGVNKALERAGRMWDDRYDMRVLATPEKMRQAIVDVLMNARRHARGRAPALDPCSSAPWFDGFCGRDGEALAPESDRPSPVSPPRTWLATRGWRRMGLIALAERPSGEGRLEPPTG